MSEKLIELGERHIIESLISPYVNGIGDDCAIVRLNDEVDIVMTTDPVPEPAAMVIGGDTDLYWRGWLLVVINSSDLAAAAAHPLAFLAALESPSDLTACEFSRFMEGISDACEAEALRFVGGNIREGIRIAGVGTAVGYRSRSRRIGRGGARPGDVICIVGPQPQFWRDAFRVMNGDLSVDRSTSPLFRPRSQASVMKSLAARDLVRAAIDNSDGLVPSVRELAVKSGCSAQIDLDAIDRCATEPASYQGNDIDPARLWFGWGDWNVVAAIDSSQLEEAVSVAEGRVFPIGSFSCGAPNVTVHRQGVVLPAPRIDSERFSRDSWFRPDVGIRGYVKMMLHAVLP